MARTRRRRRSGGARHANAGDEYFGAALKEAVTSGRLPLQRLDDMVHRVLRSMFSAGVIDHPPTHAVWSTLSGPEDAQHIAEESIVLLKNDGTLPLNAGAVRSIAVIGARADVGSCPGSSAQVDAPGEMPSVPTRRPNGARRCTFHRRLAVHSEHATNQVIAAPSPRCRLASARAREWPGRSAAAARFRRSRCR